MLEGTGGQRPALSESAQGQKRHRISGCSGTGGEIRWINCLFHLSLAFNSRSRTLLCSCSSFLFHQNLPISLLWLPSKLGQFVPTRSLTASPHDMAEWMYLLCLFNRDGFYTSQTQTLTDSKCSVHHAQISSLYEVITFMVDSNLSFFAVSDLESHPRKECDCVSQVVYRDP